MSIETQEGLGRVLVARQAFPAWSAVLCEAPLLRWRALAGREGLAELLEAFEAASPDVQAAVLSLAHPPLDSEAPRCVERRELAKEEGKQLCSLSVGTIHKLLMIVDTNAHTFFGEMELGGGAVAHGVEQSALFAVGSKAAHSCRPNCAFSTKVGSQLRYFALRPLADGEQVTISYLSETHQLNRLERRLRLLDTKAFTCSCERCTGPDAVAAVRCVHCGGGAAHCGEPGAEGDAALSDWRCSDCGMEQPTGWILLMNSVLEAHEARLQRARSQLYSIPCFAPHETADGLRRLLERASFDLTPQHSIVQRGQQLLQAWGSSRALRPPRACNRTLARLAGNAFLHSLSVRECLGVGCTKRDCPGGHPAVAVGVARAKVAVDCLLGCGGEKEREDALRLAAKYVRSWECLHGEEDADVQWMRTLAARAAV